MSCTNELYSSPAIARTATAAPPRSLANGLRRFALTCLDVWRWRQDCQDLLRLDDRLLADVGITREDAERQASEWFARWLRQRNDGA
jgi:uncharacterized protein YjiS (DUF1127 family)